MIHYHPIVDSPNEPTYSFRLPFSFPLFVVYLILPYLPLAELSNVPYELEGVEDSQGHVYVGNSVYLIKYKMLNLICFFISYSLIR